MNKTEDLSAEEVELKNKRIEKFKTELDEESKAAIMNDAASKLNELKSAAFTLHTENFSVDDCLEFFKAVEELEDKFEIFKLRPLARAEIEASTNGIKFVVRSKIGKGIINVAGVDRGKNNQK